MGIPYENYITNSLRMKASILYLVTFSLFFVFISCEKDNDQPKNEEAPRADQLSFTIEEGTDPFHPVFTNTSTVKGLVDWDMGNGDLLTGDKVSSYYPMPGDYQIMMTLLTSGGKASISKTFTQTKTDYSSFDDPLLVAISGGVDALNGKTWVIDSTASAHLGVGETTARDPNWWSAPANDKKGHFLYDDEFNFQIVGFVYTIETHGETHANGDGGAANAGIEAGYYTSVFWENEYDKDVNTDDSKRGTIIWSVKDENNTKYIELSSQAGVIGYDDGNPRKYEILEWTNNFLHLRTQGDANARYLKLIPKGYKP